MNAELIAELAERVVDALDGVDRSCERGAPDREPLVIGVRSVEQALRGRVE